MGLYLCFLHGGTRLIDEDPQSAAYKTHPQGAAVIAGFAESCVILSLRFLLSHQEIHDLFDLFFRYDLRVVFVHLPDDLNPS